ncbi:MAG TPA: hypothetical protein PKD28_02910 [Candidatus Saccharibacteria bacterium]|nr:hypothetical protein [Candidatus Saccharibacteria bacterium]
MAATATIHEANDRYSAHSVELYHQWMQEHPNHTWTRAEVDRFSGLTLLSDEGGLHFAHALCGYSGQGPHATVEILVEAGFGPREHLEAAVFNQMTAGFTK